MRYLHDRLNDDVCMNIYKYVDTYKQYFSKEVLPIMMKIVRDNMIQKMWHIMYCSGKTTMEGLSNLKRFLMSDGFHIDSLKYHPDFHFIDTLYFNNEIMRHLIRTRPHPLVAPLLQNH